MLKAPDHALPTPNQAVTEAVKNLRQQLMLQKPVEILGKKSLHRPESRELASTLRNWQLYSVHYPTPASCPGFKCQH